MQPIEHVEARISDLSTSRFKRQSSFGFFLVTRSVNAKVTGKTFQDLTAGFRRRLVDDQLTQNFQRSGIFTLHYGQLFGRALNNRERLAPRKTLPKETREALYVM